MFKKIRELMQKASATQISISVETSRAFLFTFGVMVLVFAVSDTSFAQAPVAGLAGEKKLYTVIALILRFIEGPFGALIMVTAGLGAIVAAAMGSYKAALGLFVVGVGAFILRSLVAIFFGQKIEDATYVP